MTIKEARPTEYKGILYRSKSEAMFARYLELDIQTGVLLASHDGPLFGGDFGRMQGGFVYEPKGLCVNGWTPDFIRWNQVGGTVCSLEIPILHYEVIEYKPSKPTDAYVKEFCDRCEVLSDLIDSIGLINFRHYGEFAIYYGSVFNSSRGRFVYRGPFSYWDTGDWLANYADAISATRFDLAATQEGEVESWFA